MEDYKLAYLKLFNEVTDVIAQLQQIQLKAEDILTHEKEKRTVNRPLFASRSPRKAQPASAPSPSALRPY